MAAQNESEGDEVNEVETQERIAKAWYLKQYLRQLEKLLIEEQCHTSNDSQAFRQLLDLIERDTPKASKDRRSALGYRTPYCPTCGIAFPMTEIIITFCPNCGQRIEK